MNWRGVTKDEPSRRYECQAASKKESSNTQSFFLAFLAVQSSNRVLEMAKTSFWRGVPHAKLIGLSLGAAFLTVALKLAAWRVTGSVGLLSDMAESGVNVAASLTALYALWYAAQPADRSHPYGHEKIEFFASGIEGAMILGAAFVIAFAALQHLHRLQLPSNILVGVSISLLSAFINFFVARVLLQTGKRESSIVLEADGHHLMADVWTSLGVALGLTLASLTRWTWIDPLLAFLMSLNIARIAWSLLRRSVDGLMDRALSDDEVQLIRATIERVLEPGMTYHALRTRRAGSRRYADFHLLVPGNCTVSSAHDCEMAISRAIEEAVAGIEVSTHIEPIEEPLSWNDARWQDKRAETVEPPVALVSRD